MRPIWVRRFDNSGQRGDSPVHVPSERLRSGLAPLLLPVVEHAGRRVAACGRSGYGASIIPASVATAPSMYRLNDYDLASRLSYFLWSSMPDDELLHAADLGTALR